MATITEDYVSFETAKLLKEKGFNYPCRAVYSPKGIVRHYLKEEVYAHYLKGHKKLCPTLQMAMKWLREVHNTFIEISVDEMFKDEGYQWALYYNDTKEIRPYSGWSDSYEGACEDAIRYYIENLI